MLGSSAPKGLASSDKLENDLVIASEMKHVPEMRHRRTWPMQSSMAQSLTVGMSMLNIWATKIWTKWGKEKHNIAVEDAVIWIESPEIVKIDWPFFFVLNVEITAFANTTAHERTLVMIASMCNIGGGNRWRRWLCMNLVTMLILFGQRHALLVKVYTMAHEKEHHVIQRSNSEWGQLRGWTRRQTGKNTSHWSLAGGKKTAWVTNTIP